MRKKALIIDGNSIVNRAFFGIKNLATPDGFPTNALYGFLSIYQSVSAELAPQYIAVAFDLKGPTLRHQDFADYKAGRKGMPDELAMQMPVLKEILSAMGIKQMALSGFEADDLLGTAASYLNEQDIDVYLLTGDKDALQLVGENTWVYYHGTKNKVIYDAEQVKEDMGVYPNRVVDLKGLMGDSSDNIPGVPKVGKVTANKLLAQFDNIEDIIEKTAQIENARIKNLIIEHADQAVMSKKLATIIRDVPVELELDDFSIDSPNISELVGLFQKYRLHSFLQKLGVEHASALNQLNVKSLSVTEVVNHGQAHAALKALNFKEPLYCTALYDKGNLVDDTLLYLGLCDAFGTAVIIQPTAVEGAIHALKQMHQKTPLRLIGHDLKGELLILQRYAISDVQAVFDMQIAMYLIDANRRSYALSDMALDLLGATITTQEQLLGKGAKKKTYQALETATLNDYISQRLKTLSALHKPLLQKLEELDLLTLFNDIEMPLVAVLARMEYVGFAINPSVLDVLDDELSGLITQLEADIYKLANRDFNINSPKQLGVVLFEDLGLHPIKKTKTGYSTSHDILIKLYDDHPIIEKVIDYRTYTKLKSTYVDGLRAVVNPVTGRIHSSLNQTIAATGRLSSTEPNLQNIPVRLEMGRRLRKVFVASDNHTLVDADYSQIELRVLAHMSDDEMLKKAYTDDIDIHALTASQVFEIPLAEVTSLLRSRAKEVNFGIVYGMSDYGLSENLKIDRKTAKQYIENYFKKYPKVKAFMKDCVSQCKEKGYAETMLGRKRFIPEINNKNFNVRQYGERMAMNTPIQGTAADIIKAAMVKVYWALKEANLSSELILQVHDELIIDTLPSEQTQVETILANCMKGAIALAVPLKIDMNSGASWYDTK